MPPRPFLSVPGVPGFPIEMRVIGEPGVFETPVSEPEDVFIPEVVPLAPLPVPVVPVVQGPLVVVFASLLIVPTSSLVRVKYLCVGRAGLARDCVPDQRLLVWNVDTQSTIDNWVSIRPRSVEVWSADFGVLYGIVDLA